MIANRFGQEHPALALALSLCRRSRGIVLLLAGRCGSFWGSAPSYSCGVPVRCFMILQIDLFVQGNLQSAFELRCILIRRLPKQRGSQGYQGQLAFKKQGGELLNLSEHSEDIRRHLKTSES